MERRQRKGTYAVAVDDQQAQLLGRGLSRTAIHAGTSIELIKSILN